MRDIRKPGRVLLFALGLVVFTPPCGMLGTCKYRAGVWGWFVAGRALQGELPFALWVSTGGVLHVFVLAEI